MSNPEEREAEDRYEAENDLSPVPGTPPPDDSYVRDTNPNWTNRVQPDDAPYDDPVQPPYSNSDEQLEQDEKEAIDPSNIIQGDRLRHAKPRTANRYNEGPAEDDLPEDVRDGLQGRSAVRRVMQ
ncbi:hypothetical protein VTN96DRAFT_6773 [Rasamsonia emersonii]|uniref:Histone chaperone domain-containing protein n=1 Tax=Rasamsonia emersonii (strain ATCC 16479 / CBS 393.64 / IMI 116815) TaxID=1408163 RepID=A0A0F4YWG6_RASE3|nr:hypothetical protein T310_3808 [Rasamsonia emersonii CBS 393.64]KKA22171.1 hypothetical protein T310_3808 [Rasamsonia emersonii CBS 393.64]